MPFRAGHGHSLAIAACATPNLRDAKIASNRFILPAGTKAKALNRRLDAFQRGQLGPDVGKYCVIGFGRVPGKICFGAP